MGFTTSTVSHDRNLKQLGRQIAKGTLKVYIQNWINIFS